jgi:FMN phosphatase YigB (HAD superfamily)
MYETQTTDKIMASQLATLLDHLEPAPTVLSLDCFDTLLWRKAATPADVFYTLQNHPEFIAAGLTAPLRMSAEARARQCKLFHQQGSEVTLVDIYRAHRATLTDTTIAALAQAELETEIAICYAFPATVALIREAARRGIAVIIVSDTYFTVTQLQTLLASALPADVLAAIQHVFCSSAYQQSKSQGLFTKVLHTLKQPAANLFHLGDNLTADYIAPRQLNIRALHVVRDTASLADLYRLQIITAAIVDPAIRSQRALHNPFHGILAADAAAPKPETQLGYASLGPLLYAFATYLQKEVAELEQQGKTPKVLFLMRDAYLPSLACEVLAGQPMGYPVRISRFASFAASFRTVHDIDRYLLTVMPSQRFQDIVRQLGLPAKVAEPLIKTAERHAEPVAEFTRLIHRNDIVNIIFTKSTEYRQRLLRYLEKTIQLTPGDTLLCVDLGYSGTTQQLLTPVFQDMNFTLEVR